MPRPRPPICIYTSIHIYISSSDMSCIHVMMDLVQSVKLACGPLLNLAPIARVVSAATQEVNHKKVYTILHENHRL
jgi:hypothetical protein